MANRVLVAVIAAALTAFASGAQAQLGADVNISPKRVTFDEGDRSATVYLFNQGDEPATYTVDLVDRVMLPDGQIAALADHPEASVSSASAFVQHTPRRVTLPPKQSQSIRVRMRPPATGSSKEYRSHLTVTILPPEDVGLTADQLANIGEQDLSLQVIALFSVSIPVIVREGAIDARAGIENAAFVPAAQVGGSGGILLDLVRLGANSVYGDIEIYTGSGESQKLISAVRGVAVYPEIDRRAVVAPLASPLTSGELLRIVYIDDDIRPGAELAAVSLAAP